MHFFDFLDGAVEVVEGRGKISQLEWQIVREVQILCAFQEVIQMS